MTEATESERAAGFGAILVPLDGSSLAEQALPIAGHLARATGSDLLLVRVNPLVSMATALASEGAMVAPEVYQQLVDEEDRLAAEYLEARAAAVRAESVAARTALMRGEIAQCLLDTAQREAVGLIAMTTHGRTGVSRFALGSVADRLVRAGRVPVLLLRSGEQDGERLAEALHRALVPLDGSDRAEQALPVCQQFVERVVDEVVLTRVVERGADSVEVADAQRYLEVARARFEQASTGRNCAVSTAVLVGGVAEEILRLAAERNQMIIMATHGRSGATRWALGSVADRVLQGASTPVLLVRSLPQDLP